MLSGVTCHTGDSRPNTSGLTPPENWGVHSLGRPRSDIGTAREKPWDTAPKSQPASQPGDARRSWTKGPACGAPKVLRLQATSHCSRPRLLRFGSLQDVLADLKLSKASRRGHFNLWARA